MQSIYTNTLEKLKTPVKHGELVLKPSYKKGEFDSHAVDCPFVFTHECRFYMTFLGWDSIGYKTGLAVSDDLINWRKVGLVIDRGPRGSATEFNAALNWILRDNDIYSNGSLLKVNGKFLGTYHAYPSAGYESGPAVIGLCRSDDLLHWELDEPFLSPFDGADWERGGLYKSCIIKEKDTYYLFYNAKNVTEGSWREQTGVVTSTDLKTWTRYIGNPVLPVGAEGSFDDIFASDPCVLKCGDIWAMFYFGLSSDGKARDSVAFSHDLLHWEKSGEILVDTGPAGSIDSIYAHKPSVIYHNSKLYHFYCAVAPMPGGRIGEIEHNEIRGIVVCNN